MEEQNLKAIYFVRHSIRDTSMQEDAGASLTEEGLDLAEKLKLYFIGKDIKEIYTSPYLRTVQTITPAANLLSIISVEDNQLREREIGAWIDNFSEYASKQWADFSYKLDNGESLEEVQKRMYEAFKGINSKSEGNYILSGHGTSLEILFNQLTNGEFGYDEWKEMQQPHVFKLVYNVGKDAVESFESVEFQN
ncbi:hypothetical protein BG262_00655 [Floricoccus penangensis]|uniref:Phosphoglycerate mutase n=1 Tax=Floricoccus penangensis TaxID=1859475 RepID=A0A9Q5P197_9LACT|nr:histidine phosphatase family protein [Floricoccus penangensis]OFI47165.1 hypothetical protein BG262_00655 [Floricoccus penangensis]